MKWMGGWSWDEYLAAPQQLIDDIIGEMNKEYEAIERLRNQ